MTNRRFALLLMLLLLVLSAPAGAQQPAKLYRIGFLSLTLGENAAPTMKAFRERLRELGYVEGKNLVFDFRSAEGHEERLAELATELVRARPDVLVAGLGALAPLAVKKATATIPIVFTVVGDPVGTGIVPSLARPGANITGLSSQAIGIAGKRLQLLKELAPGVQAVAVLMNPATPYSHLALKEIRATAETLRVRVEVIELKSPDQAASRFEAAIKAGMGAMIVVEDPLTYGIRQQLIDLAAKHELPVIYGYLDIAEAGGLMSYGPDRRDLYRKAAEYVDKILKGTKPGDLPVEQPTKFDLVINTKTAKALRLNIPQSLLLQADHVIK